MLQHVVKFSMSLLSTEISQQEGVKQSIGGEGQVGQFHKVLIDADHSNSELELPDGNFVITLPTTIDASLKVQHGDDVEDAVTSFAETETLNVGQKSSEQGNTFVCS